MFFLILLLITAAQGLPDGAPSKACESLLPYHGGGILPQRDPSPYLVTAMPINGGARVLIESSINIPFEGFMLQARTPARQIFGIFEAAPEGTHTLDCVTNGDTLTHNGPNKKNVVDVIWRPTNEYEGPIIFNATVAQDYATFWVGIESQPVEIGKGSIGREIVPNFPTRPRPRVTTPPYFSPEVARESSTEFDSFYNGCDVTKLCFGYPENCVSTKNCRAVLAVTVSGDRYEFEMKALRNAKYVAMGLSDDEKMGEDSILECVRVGTSRINAFMSYSVGRSVSRLNNPQLGITLLNSSINNDDIYCKVLRDVRTNVNGREYDLANEKFFLLVASGESLKPSNEIGYHQSARIASAEKRSLADVSSISAASKILIRLHGAFMLAAWLGAASVGILLARYYRQTWVGSTMCGKDQWFAWHRMFMVLTWALTMTGFVLIFVELKAWSSEDNPHAILGVIITALCFFQPIGAYFRPHPGTPKRPIFNWLHWLGGNLAHILAFVAIFFAVKLTKAELPEWVDWILVAYVAFHVIIHLTLSVLGCVSEKSADRRVNSFPMKDLGGSGRTSAFIDRNDDAPYSGTRKFLLALYIIVVEALVIVLIITTVTAPIEEFWKSL